jgi:hypothetical protein
MTNTYIHTTHVLSPQADKFLCDTQFLSKSLSHEIYCIFCYLFIFNLRSLIYIVETAYVLNYEILFNAFLWNLLMLYTINKKNLKLPFYQGISK